jgi:hyperosmotically inducible protein
MKLPSALIVCAGFTLLTAAAAAAQEKPKEKPKETTVVVKDDTTPRIQKGARVVTDGAVTTAVKTRLMKDKVARASSIDVDTKDGVVTIAGAVPSEADKLRLGHLVEKTTGVKGVENDLTVSAVATTGRADKGETKIVIKDDATPKAKKAGQVVADASVTTAVKSRLMTDEVARGTSIDVDTKQGVVTITGTVPTAADKTRIGALVSKTTGVKRVDNQLTVK